MQLPSFKRLTVHTPFSTCTMRLDALSHQSLPLSLPPRPSATVLLSEDLSTASHLHNKGAIVRVSRSVETSETLKRILKIVPVTFYEGDSCTGSNDQPYTDICNGFGGHYIGSVSVSGCDAALPDVAQLSISQSDQTSAAASTSALLVSPTSVVDASTTEVTASTTPLSTFSSQTTNIPSSMQVVGPMSTRDTSTAQPTSDQAFQGGLTSVALASNTSTPSTQFSTAAATSNTAPTSTLSPGSASTSSSTDTPQASSTADPSDSDSGWSKAALISTCVMVPLAVLSIIVTVLLWWLSRRRKATKERDSERRRWYKQQQHPSGTSTRRSSDSGSV